MTTPDLRDVLRSRVGGFFTNTRRSEPDTCEVCTGPAPSSVCPPCREQRLTFDRQLADLVVPLTYIKARMSPTHQSEHHMYAYKGNPPARRCAEDLALTILAGTVLHRDCVAHVADGPWQAVTFVPSARAQGAGHPAAQLARQVVEHGPPAQPVGLHLGPRGADTRRVVLNDRFAVPDRWLDRVVGQHVVAVDDVWVSGAKAQSVAIALRAAGARWVTVLCVGRWLRHDWADHRDFITKLTSSYDPARCPVTGDACPT